MKKVAVVGGQHSGARPVLEHLRALNVQTTKIGDRMNVPKAAEGVLIIIDFVSHDMDASAAALAKRRGIPFTRITRKWAKSYEKVYDLLGLDPDKVPTTIDAPEETHVWSSEHMQVLIELVNGRIDRNRALEALRGIEVGAAFRGNLERAVEYAQHPFYSKILLDRGWDTDLDWDDLKFQISESIHAASDYGDLCDRLRAMGLTFASVRLRSKLKTLGMFWESKELSSLIELGDLALSELKASEARTEEAEKRAVAAEEGAEAKVAAAEKQILRLEKDLEDAKKGGGDTAVNAAETKSQIYGLKERIRTLTASRNAKSMEATRLKRSYDGLKDGKRRLSEEYQILREDRDSIAALLEKLRNDPSETFLLSEEVRSLKSKQALLELVNEQLREEVEYLRSNQEQPEPFEEEESVSARDLRQVCGIVENFLSEDGPSVSPLTALAAVAEVLGY